jgi:hypothetical protein
MFRQCLEAQTENSPKKRNIYQKRCNFRCFLDKKRRFYCIENIVATKKHFSFTRNTLRTSLKRILTKRCIFLPLLSVFKTDSVVDLRVIRIVIIRAPIVWTVKDLVGEVAQFLQTILQSFHPVSMMVSRAFNFDLSGPADTYTKIAHETGKLERTNIRREKKKRTAGPGRRPNDVYKVLASF